MKNEFRPWWQVMRAFFLAISLLLVPTGLPAQEPNPYNGTWSGKYTTPKGEPRSVILNLRDGGGTWKNHVRVKQDTCLGRELPVAIARASAKDLAIRIEGSKFMAGCKDFGMKFSRTGDNAFEGRMGKGIEVRFVRQ